MVLGTPSYRERARAVAASLARHAGVAGAAELLERLAVTGSPVLRTADPWPLRPG